jgi:transposase
MNWNDQPYFAALDWAHAHHDVVIIDRSGQLIKQLRFEHSQAGWEQLREQLKPYGQIAVAVETSQGTVIEQLLAVGVRVYPVNPKSAQRYRERHAPSGVKDDSRDAWSLADALRVDGQTWRALSALDPLIAQLRLLCRDEVALIEQRTVLINQLRQALHEYYPAALEAFPDWVKPSSWDFVLHFPTPQALQAAGRRKWEKFLHVHRLWRTEESVQHRLEVFSRATGLCGQPATIAAKSLLAVTLARLLKLLQTQLDEYRKQIAELFQKHPDHDLFGSLPGCGEKLAPRLLAELGEDRNLFTSAESLQCYAGTAPLTLQSGKLCYQKARRACHKPLRATLHLWADLSRAHCTWAQTYYQLHRKKGQSHATALRCLANRWLNILWKMWQTHRPYDEALHTKNQTTHGSWILSLTSSENL